MELEKLYARRKEIEKELTPINREINWREFTKYRKSQEERIAKTIESRERFKKEFSPYLKSAREQVEKKKEDRGATEEQYIAQYKDRLKEFARQLRGMRSSLEYLKRREGLAEKRFKELDEAPA